MTKSVSDFGNQVSAVFKTLSPAKLICLTVLVIATIWGLIVLINWSGKPEYMPLYSKLSAQDAGEVVARLREQKIPYKLSHDGGTVQIPREHVYDVRLDLASQGLPKGSGVGFEVFDNTKLGMTEFVQNINYQRALQGELSRTINGLAEVESSRVHIVMPPRSLFIEEDDPATASVILRVHHGRWLNNDQIKGIVHLVSSSVPRLMPENVTVVDQKSQLLAGVEDQPSAAQISSDQLEFQKRKERLLEKGVLTMLEQVLGKNKAIVRVSCDLDFIQQESTEEIYLPDNQVVRSEQSFNEVASQTKDAPLGVPGMAANVIRDGAEKTKSTSPASFKKQDLTRNYEIGKTINRKIMPVGKLNKLSVAVIVDGKYSTIVKGKGDKRREEIKYEARSDEEMAKLESIVKRAVNFDQTRGDMVEVTNIPFNTEKLSQPPEVKGVGSWLENLKAYGSHIKYVMGGLFVLFTFMYIIRPLIKWLTDTSWEDVELLEHLPRTVAEIERQYANKDAAKSKYVDQAAQIIQGNQEDTAQLMQQWLKET
ncbi:MAG: flagellar basal-body MS-ring/collar protein FliF [Desulfobacteraceae bacterium]|jgi:flagellar M-ring protein FliF